MAISRFIAFLLLLLLLLPASLSAGIYKYRDENGRLNFVDDESKIPAKYRNGVTSISEAGNSIPAFKAPAGSEARAEKAKLKQQQSEEADARKLFKKHQTKVRIDGNRVLVPVAVALGNREVKLSLLLDTGASSTVFHRKALTELDLPNGKKYKARVAGGGIVKSERIKFRHINIGPFREERAYAMVINLQGKSVPFDGMLGMDFLRSHPYQIDFKTEVINWEILD